MFGAISHELRTPLNGMLTFLKAAIEFPGINEYVLMEYLNPSLDCSDHLLHLVNDILTCTEMSDGKEIKMDYDNKINFEDIINKSIRMFKL